MKTTMESLKWLLQQCINIKQRFQDFIKFLFRKVRISQDYLVIESLDWLTLYLMEEALAMSHVNRFH